MHKPTSVSLITTVYNREDFLAEAIESVRLQTYPHWELIVWDDGSTDRSVEIAHQGCVVGRQNPSYPSRTSRACPSIETSHRSVLPPLHRLVG